MGILKTIAGALFGKTPEIFDKQGNVKHQLPDKKWSSWQARYTTSSEFNWRNHSGNKRAAGKENHS